MHLVAQVKRVVGEARCRLFDFRHGVETCGDVPADAAPPAASTAEHGIPYAPSHPKFLRELFLALSIRHEDYTFVDLGSGKGRALLLASEFPFRRVIGVEYSEALHRVAIRNVARYRNQSQRCRDIVCLHVDALEFDFPADPLVLYMYNPFRPPVLGPVMQRLQASLDERPRDVVLLYSAPFHASVVERETALQPTARSRYHTAYRTPKSTIAIGDA